MNMFREYLDSERLMKSSINGTGVILNLLVDTKNDHLIARVAFDQERQDEYIDITEVKNSDCKIYSFDDEFNKLYGEYSKKRLAKMS